MVNCVGVVEQRGDLRGWIQHRIIIRSLLAEYVRSRSSKKMCGMGGRQRSVRLDEIMAGASSSVLPDWQLATALISVCLAARIETALTWHATPGSSDMAGRFGCVCLSGIAKDVCGCGHDIYRE